MPHYAHIALPIPKRTLFTYTIPDDWHDACLPGWLALVPMGKGTRLGVVWRVDEHTTLPPEQIRPLLEIQGESALFDAPLLHLLTWMASYYLQPIGAVVAAAMPPGITGERTLHAHWLPTGDPLLPTLPDALRPLAEAIRTRKKLAQTTLARRFGTPRLESRLRELAKKGVIRLEEVWPEPKLPPRHNLLNDDPGDEGEENRPVLNPEQAACVATLRQALGQPSTPFLLEGVTGSGKTEVYFQVMETCLEQGRQALLLVPEIALTPQLVRRYRERFGENGLAVFHSGLGDRQRREAWQRVRNGQAQVALGARSALFAPFVNLGLIVVDEEHDPSYKQEGAVPYQARDMAVVRARQAKATLVLGSATPAMESLANARQGKYGYLRISQRATGVNLPRVELINLREEGSKGPPGSHLLSRPLLQAMSEELAAGRQALLFLNRRGFAPALLCARCGQAVICPNCSVALTLHKPRQLLVCHYCDHQQGVPEVCPQCRQLSLISLGPGTQRLEKEVRDAFPQARVARLDRDAVGSGGVNLEELLDSFRQGHLDILVGTQMVAKGHHFPNLTLVGVVLAETTLWQPDFRAAERTFQLVAQVAGRAGREGEGRVLVQTFDPEHYAIQAAASHDVAALAAHETPFRQEAGYPPFARLGLVRFSSLDQQAGEVFCRDVRGALPSLVVPGVTILGPAPAPLSKLRNRYRWQLLVKDSSNGRHLHRVMEGLVARMELLGGVGFKMEVDIDPQSFM